MTEEVKVSGMGFKDSIKYVKEKLGPDALNDILKELEESDREIFSKYIYSTDWYPYRTFINFLSIIERKSGYGMSKEVGKFSAQRDLETVYRGMLQRSPDPKSALNKSPIIWKMTYNQGNLEVSVEEKSAMIRMLDFPTMGKAHCRLLEGWIEEAFLMTGALNPKVKETKCRTSGDEYCEFSLRWE